MEGSSVHGSTLTNIRFEATERNKIHEGSVLSLRVEKRSGRWVHLAGRSFRLVARNSAQLRAGEVVTVRATTSGGKLVLELLERRTPDSLSLTAGSESSRSVRLISEILNSFKIADTPIARSLLSALLVSRRHVLEHLLQKSLRHASRIDGILSVSDTDDRKEVERPVSDSVRTRFALEWTDRDLPSYLLKREHLAELMRWFAGGYPDSSGEEREHGSGDNDTPRKGFSRTTRNLKKYCFRSELRINHPLQLYNHILPATGDLHWVVIPLGAFRIERMSPSVRGVLKIAVDIRRQVAVRALLSVEPPVSFREEIGVSKEDGIEQPLWWFYWTLDGGVKLQKTGYQGNVKVPPESLLATLGVTGHTERVCKEDGLSVFQETVGLERIQYYG